MKNLLALLAIVMLAFPLSGCTEDEIVANSYKTLKSANTMYEAAMGAVAEAQADGIITVEKRAEINAKATAYVHSFRTACSVLYAYELKRETKDTATIEEAKAKTKEALGLCTDAIADLITYIAESGVKMETKE